MRTQIHDWMIKSTMNHFQLFAWAKHKGKLLYHVTVQRYSRAVMKTSIRFLERKSRLFKDSLAVQVLRAQGRSVPGAPWPTKRLLVQVRGEAQDGGDGRLSAPITHLTPVKWVMGAVCLALVQCGDVLTLSQPLGYSSNTQVAHQNSVWWGLSQRIKFWNAIDSKISKQ